jgi:hypothetical protein
MTTKFCKNKRNASLLGWLGVLPWQSSRPQTPATALDCLVPIFANTGSRLPFRILGFS